ncbi:MAG: hypothetical protein E7674_02855 [Ruminococcaceae bacterium]|nr:hypothetical protein [Oscillospiraceae bacterium]
MAELVNFLTLKTTFSDSNMMGPLVASYLMLALFMFVSFVNIYSIDKHEFLTNVQETYVFKRRMFFIIMFSREKKVVSKKTFILEILGYVITILVTVSFLISLKLTTEISFILLSVSAVVVIIFGSITGFLYRKIKNK